MRLYVCYSLQLKYTRTYLNSCPAIFSPGFFILQGTPLCNGDSVCLCGSVAHICYCSGCVSLVLLHSTHSPCAIAVYMHMYLTCVRECMYVECAYSMLAALLPYMLLVYAICLTNVYCVFQHWRNAILMNRK